MLYATIGQGRVFAWMMAAGAVAALWYALCAGLRRLLEAGPWLSMAVDALFGAGAAALFCLALYAACYGELRLYALLGAALGFALCAGALYAPGRRAAARLARAARRLPGKLGGCRWIKTLFR